jgi:hypothetical protein
MMWDSTMSGSSEAPLRPLEALGGPWWGSPTPWEPLDLPEAAQRWRKRAEDLHRLSQRHERLAHELRRRADHAEQMAKFFDGTGRWPKSTLLSEESDREGRPGYD